ncbi:MAG: phenylalanine--tRNA ligase subunit beta [Spirochaetales bacterium]|nr:phenylalanine--tRNA ligase subunit beta [Spirochaetales bacterium]
MPKIETTESLFFGLMGRTIDDAGLEAILPRAKAELDEHDAAQKVIKFELNDTNRPDLWSAAGLARQLKTYESAQVPLYDFFSTPQCTMDNGGRTFICHKEAAPVRAFSLGFAASGCTVTEDILLALIQSQEKLCFNFGRKRRTIAMGIYRSDLIKFPVHYTGADPDRTRFTPLGMTEELSLREILKKHPKGQEYGYIVADKPVYPYLCDDNGDTLSFPPVINSARIGAVEVGDSNLFVEMSGPELKDLILCASIMACDMADLGFEILPVKVIFETPNPFGSELTIPYYYQKPAFCTKSKLARVSGLALSDEQIVKALARMGVHAVTDSDNVYATVPEYRDDFLHEVDLIEDVIIGHGLENFTPVMNLDFTIGRLSPAEELSRKVKDIMVGLGFQEMMYNYLGSKKEYCDRMNISDEKAIHIANPMSENYEMVRPSILPCLLESESVSGHAVYPHCIFEVGKVAYLCPEDNSGTVTRNSLGFFASDSRIGFNQVSSYENTLMYFLRKEYTLQALENDPRFIEGRCASIICDGKTVGCFGEINPAVLENWGCSMPSIACEIDLDALL